MPGPAARSTGCCVLPTAPAGSRRTAASTSITGTPPAPWANVIANPLAGCLATDAGLGYTWAGNSQANRLTPWSNDPVSDPPAEAVYLRDERDRAVLDADPAARPAATRRPSSATGPGTRPTPPDRDGLVGRADRRSCPVDDPVKVLRLRVTNRGDRPRRLSAAFFAEWVLGTTREQTAPYVVTEVDPGTGALFARNAFNARLRAGGGVRRHQPAPADGHRRPAEFLGRNRSPAHPAALERVGLSGHTGPGLDPCAALHGPVRGAAGRDAVTWCSCSGRRPTPTARDGSPPEYREPGRRRGRAARGDRGVGPAARRPSRVKTPDPALDLLVNRWLPYQVLACRLWGRSAFYQSGGAYGFRDQLQDVLALLYAEPGEARAHLLRAAGPAVPRGGRAALVAPAGGPRRPHPVLRRLPLAAVRGRPVRRGHRATLGCWTRRCRSSAGRRSTTDEHEVVLPAGAGSDETDRCTSTACGRWTTAGSSGPHGLPLMGCGDWNDGMNLVGAGGNGESVWVAWFQVVVRTEFAAVAEARGDTRLASRLRDQADQLRGAVEEHAWDGEWYLRAGSTTAPRSGRRRTTSAGSTRWRSRGRCSRAATRQRAGRAVDAAVRHLVDRGDRLVKLFAPPFDAGTLQPGYIKGYVPGIRENGGQYTHAAIWLVQALAGLGRGTEAFALWQMLNPIEHADTPQDVARYRVEPYVVAADVYGVPPHVGRGGWTWYTGSAAWLYRAALETLLGFSKLGDHLGFEPRVPSSWPGYEVTYRHGTAIYTCRVENPSGDGRRVTEVWIDETLAPDRFVRLNRRWAGASGPNRSGKEETHPEGGGD